MLPQSANLFPRPAVDLVIRNARGNHGPSIKSVQDQEKDERADHAISPGQFSEQRPRTPKNSHEIACQASPPGRLFRDGRERLYLLPGHVGLELLERAKDSLNSTL